MCGIVRGYQYHDVDGIYQNNEGSTSLEGPYVDGVSITHGYIDRLSTFTLQICPIQCSEEMLGWSSAELSFLSGSQFFGGIVTRI